jgi:hypothetical protein
LNKAGLAQLRCRVFALIEIGVVSQLIARYTVPGLRSLLKKIGTLLNPDAKKPAGETS